MSEKQAKRTRRINRLIDIIVELYTDRQTRTAIFGRLGDAMLLRMKSEIEGWNEISGRRVAETQKEAQ